MRPINVQVEVLSDYGAFEGGKTIPLGPNETRTIDLLVHIDGSSGGIRVTYDGAEKDIVLSGGLENPEEGYSAQIPFLMAPSNTKVSEVAVSSVGLTLGAPNPLMKFPSGTRFGVYLALRNASARPISISPTLYYMQGPEVKKNVLTSLTLAAGQSRHWSPDQLSTELGLPKLDGTINLVFSYLGGASDVIMANGSIDQTRNYVFEINMKAVGKSQAKFLKAWDVSNGNNTMISVLNLGENDQDLLISFFYDGGRYKVPVHLEAGGSAMLNVNEIMTMQQPDSDGNKIPLSTTRGSAVLTGSLGYTESINVGVSVGVLNVSTATCGNTCPTCFGYSDSQVRSDSSTAPVGGTATFQAWAFGQDGLWRNVTNGSPSNGVIVSWSSGNSNVATSQGQGNFKGVSAGSFSAQADASLLDENPDCVEGGHSPCPASPYFGSAAGTITPPVPTNFRQTSTSDAGNGDLHFGYAWDSTSGRLSDLSACTVGEIVTYPGGNPYKWQSPPFPANSNSNPIVADGAATSGVGVDDNFLYPSSTFVKPYSNASFTATQYFRYRCTNVNNGAYVNLLGPLSIVRSVDQNTNGTWKFTVTKPTGGQATINPLP